MEIPKSYYLAHPLSSRREVREWEIGFEERTGIKLLNPFYDVYRPDIEALDKYILNPRKKTSKKVVEDDLNGIKIQEGLLCFIDDKVAVGTFQEMVYGFIEGKIVYSVIINKNLLRHPWLVYHSKEIFRSLNEFEIFVVENMQ